jgi:hypothetical protein
MATKKTPDISENLTKDLTLFCASGKTLLHEAARYSLKIGTPHQFVVEISEQFEAIECNQSLDLRLKNELKGLVEKYRALIPEK